MENLFSDVGADATMFRIVCKSNLTMALAENLAEQFVEILVALDSLGDGYKSIHRIKEELNNEVETTASEGGMSTTTAVSVVLAAGKWKGKLNKEQSKREQRRRLSLTHGVC